MANQYMLQHNIAPLDQVGDGFYHGLVGTMFDEFDVNKIQKLAVVGTNVECFYPVNWDLISSTVPQDPSAVYCQTWHCIQEADRLNTNVFDYSATPLEWTRFDPNSTLVPAGSKMVSDGTTDYVIWFLAEYYSYPAV